MFDRVLTVLCVLGLLLVVYCISHWVLFAVVYELVVLFLVPAFSLVSRSYKKSWALSLLLATSCVTGGLLFVLCCSDVVTRVGAASDNSSATSTLLLVQLVAAAKTPTTPFLFWLPEVHVEAT